MASIDWHAQIWAPAFAGLRIYLPAAIASGTLSTSIYPFVQEFIDKGTCSPIADPKKIGDWALKNVPDWSECVLAYTNASSSVTPDPHACVKCIIERLQNANKANAALMRQLAFATAQSP
jgi:hypothetical protein